MTPKPTGKKLVTNNPKAFHLYEILERIEAGLMLIGCEVKSIRAGEVTIKEGFARIIGKELWLVNAHISPYKEGNRFNHEPLRNRKLLLHRSEIKKLVSKMTEKGLVLVPIGLYFDKGKVKVELGLGKPKKLFDKRKSLKEREVKRYIDRSLKNY